MSDSDMSILERQITELLHRQRADWPVAKTNFEALEKVLVRELKILGVRLKIQFNPARIVSTAARVDQKSIAARPCFLCASNRPPEQGGVRYGNYEILVNPFPIFHKHFTIVADAHVPQTMQGRFPDLLQLATELPGFVVFYNGPKCGASAPDHFHFQAGERFFMPVDIDLDELKKRLGRSTVAFGARLWAVQDGIRNFFVLEGKELQALELAFQLLINQMPAADPEPMMNVMAFFEENKWQVLIFPRALHRPQQYFAEGSQQFLISPGAVDLGGVLIVSRQEDFYRISEKEIQDILEQVLLSKSDFEQLVQQTFQSIQ